MSYYETHSYHEGLEPGKSARFWCFSFLVFFCVLVFSLIGCKKSDGNSSQNGTSASARNSYNSTSRDEVTFQVTSTRNELSVRIQIAPAHHAYLDSGKDGNLIPISFDWQTMIRDGHLSGSPRIVAKPDGKFDSKVEATVLKGSGTFVFSTKSPNWPNGKSFKVLTQICNERTGQCYPPSNKVLKIP